MAVVGLKLDNGQYMVFERSATWGGLMGALFSASALMAFVLTSPPMNAFLAGALGFLGFLSFFAAFLKTQLKINRVDMNYVFTTGAWPKKTQRKGHLDELKRVILTKENAKWVVSLDFFGWDATLPVYESISEVNARKKLQFFTQSLRTNAVDVTGEDEVATTWDSVPERTQTRSFIYEDSVDISKPPQPLKTKVAAEGFRIDFPRRGLNTNDVILLLFGGGFAAVSGLGLLILMNLAKSLLNMQIDYTGQAFIGYFLCGLFFFLGIAVIARVLMNALSKDRISVERNTIYFETLFLGSMSNEFHISRREISDVVLQPSESFRGQLGLYIIADNGVISIDLRTNPKALKWVKNALIQYMRTGRSGAEMFLSTTG